MRIELRDEHRRRIGRIEADPALRPTRVSVVDPGHGPGREVFLHWDTAVDDAGQLRRCVACGCADLFREKVFPQITGLVVLMAFAGAVVGLLGMVTPTLLALMIFVLALDVAILLVSRQRLVCYRCRSAYHGLPIARYHRPWDRAIADRHPWTSPDRGAAAAMTNEPGAAAAGTTRMPEAPPARQGSVA